MTDLLQDLFNRSTFFSTQPRSAELRGSLGGALWKQINRAPRGHRGFTSGVMRRSFGD
ncbi:hypothetical protein [Erwinia psidii]|nr:hypothetical protein [Erwinia psidii]